MTAWVTSCKAQLDYPDVYGARDAARIHLQATPESRDEWVTWASHYVLLPRFGLSRKDVVSAPSGPYRTVLWMNTVDDHKRFLRETMMYRNDRWVRPERGRQGQTEYSLGGPGGVRCGVSRTPF